MKLIIASRGAAGSILKNIKKYSDITHVVSIGTVEPQQRKPRGFDRHPAKKLRLEFFDISCEKRGIMNGPSERDVKKLVAFFKDALKTKDPHFLIHCQAGISRSTAAGLILLQLYHKDRERAIKELFVMKQSASPNVRMLRLAHDIFEKEQLFKKGQ